MTAEHPRPVGATYRLQLTPEFGFADAGELVDHLAGLGVTHLYLSPLLTAREGSTHGYDVADPSTVSAALGGEEGLRVLADRAHAAGLGLVGDIVPNHVGTGHENPLWMSLLAEGAGGGGGLYFDVDWAPPLPGAANKVVVPVLGDPYGVVLERGELVVVEEEGACVLRYHEHRFPLSGASIEALRRSGGVEAVRGEAGHPESWSRLHALLEQQHYRLVHWRVGDAVVNYRRFFAINELAAVRVEDPDVFAGTHGTIIRLVRDGVLDGLRLDHIDGLADPAGYLARLRDALPDAWIVAEKILAPGETLPDWPIAGGTGYDFLGDVLRIQVDPAAEDVMTETAEAFHAWPVAPAGPGDPGAADHEEAVRQAKRETMERDLLADTDRVARRLWELCAEHPRLRDVDWHACRAVVTGTIAELPVYRTYAAPGERARDEDLERIRAAVAAARDRGPGAAPDLLWDALVEVFADDLGPANARDELVRRFQQLSGAVMAKGVEDTYLYRQHRLAALNEVGVEPHEFGEGVESFHDANRRRAETAPQAMLTTATHDTKRGEDTRMRIAALSELPERWRKAVRGWVEGNRSLVTDTPRGPAPDAATEYLCYQTLVGVWPTGPLDEALPDVTERVVAYLVKACREAKLRTSWTDPDEGFERGLEDFVRGLLVDSGPSATFLDEMAEVAGVAGRIAAVTGLAQVLLRLTSPGVPDTYQGAELWGDDLVDPDNRRPVDFARRRAIEEELRAGVPATDLLASWQDGRVKQWVLGQALRARRAHPGCVGVDGRYVPLAVTGARADHVVAYARVAPDGDALVTIALRLPGALMAEGFPLAEAWEDTAVDVGDVDVREDLLAGRPVEVSGGAVRLGQVLADLPVALLAP